MRHSLTTILLIAGLAVSQTDVAVGQTLEATATTPAANPDDVSSIDAIVTASYEVISGPAGPREWDRERSLFHPLSRHIPTRPNQNGGSDADVQTVETFIARSSPYFEKNGFYEYEIARKVERFGDIAHAFSTYEWSKTKGGPVGGRGINSFQLVFDGQRWWIVSVFWAQESDKHPIPAEYLPSGK